MEKKLFSPHPLMTNNHTRHTEGRIHPIQSIDDSKFGWVWFWLCLFVFFLYKEEKTADSQLRKKGHRVIHNALKKDNEHSFAMNQLSLFFVFIAFVSSCNIKLFVNTDYIPGLCCNAFSLCLGNRKNKQKHVLNSESVPSNLPCDIHVLNRIPSHSFVSWLIECRIYRHWIFHKPFLDF